ncbi:MAG TPA: tetratricopeptide repeat protein [Vicinamibacteria bacterium]|nr:tetratricopeptide repeat protein [Vicinamibacteria bacterium]
MKKLAPADRRSSPAVVLFEKGVKALGRKEYDKAREHFDAIVSSHPEERDVVERARSYRMVCERAAGEGKRGAYRPKGFDELLNYGVFLHNRGEFDDALKSLRQAAEIHPRNENVLYCLAATSARAGDTDSALKALRSAISVSPETRAQARRDSDFDVLREDDEFNALVYEQA